ncbi:LysM peptidoglycan-binding domain-containing protein [Candidatus Saccharibacteria bacterium]|nr:LysM peptidoglycan-binding domain-containing protein [Candidatus Saccharibacteria bacterium]
MIAKSKKSKRFFRVVPYLLASIAIVGLAFWGSLDKSFMSDDDMNMQSIASSGYSVSADQIQEFYIVSELASSMNLPTAEAVNVNYNSLSQLSELGQVSAERLEKNTIVDISHISRGVIEHTVAAGETMLSISNAYRILEDQIRWSNGLKTSDVHPGQVLLIPSTPGIVYRVKSGDTVDSLAAKYGSTAESIISFNDLENSSLTVGSTIILPSGELPVTERPEYVAPRSSGTYVATRRTYWTSSNPMPYGWCTYYAWGQRSKMGGNYVLPGGLGNANTWDNVLSGSYLVNRSPAPGAVFQTDTGYYGHVGIVDSVNADGTITISDMNGISGWGRVGTKTIGQDEWGRYKYIHGRL